jgi:hypothetical protein
MKMHRIATAFLFALVAAAFPAFQGSVNAQTVVCYKKTCAEYPDGSKICKLTPVSCDQVQIQ